MIRSPPPALVAKPAKTSPSKPIAINTAKHRASPAAPVTALSFVSCWIRKTFCPCGGNCLYVFRRMEAWGELRGGRFVQGFAGEQYALPEAVSTLREIRKQSRQGDLIAISAADPFEFNRPGYARATRAESAWTAHFIP